MARQEDGPVCVSYDELVRGGDRDTLHESMLAAFGSDPACLGLIIVKDLPKHFQQLRRDALMAAARFAQNVPEEVRERYTDPESSFSFGWSHGKEVMNGRPDRLKGSYYANPMLDRPQATEASIREHPSYLRDNIWPSEQDCPGFEHAFKALARFMAETGFHVARACDSLIATNSKGASAERLLSSSQCSKARLLHYYAPAGQVVRLDGAAAASKQGADSQQEDSWCGDHLDHSILTALCPAMYLFHPILPVDATIRSTSTHTSTSRPAPLIVPAPTSSSGLFIRTRAGRTVKAVIPPDCLAFQTGEALQLLTEDKLRATPHYVAAGAEGPILPAVLDRIRAHAAQDPSWARVEQGVISRETMAVFLQPDVDAVISSSGETFGQFTARILQEHYGEASATR